MSNPVDPDIYVPVDLNGQILRFYRVLPVSSAAWFVHTAPPTWTGSYPHILPATGATGFYTDSPRIVYQNLVNGGHSSPTLSGAIECYSAGCTGPTGPSATLEDLISSCEVPAPNDGSCPQNPFGGGLCYPLYGLPDQANPDPCSIPPPPPNTGCELADGVVQFISIITAKPGFNWLGHQSGICLTLSPLGLPGATGWNNCTDGINLQYWQPITFNLGDCKVCSQCISLIGFTCSNTQCNRPAEGFTQPPNDAFYNSVQVDVSFQLTGKSLSRTSFKRACYVYAVTTGLNQNCYQANFAIARLCYNDPSNPIAILIITQNIPLNYLHSNYANNAPCAYFIISATKNYALPCEIPIPTI